MNRPLEENGDYVQSAKDKLENAGRLACEKAEDAWRLGTEQVRQNPIPIVIGALVAGAVIGALLSRGGEKKVEETTLANTRQWVESLASQIADKVSHSVDKLSHSSPKRGWFGFTPHEPTILEQAQEVGKRFKFWS